MDVADITQRRCAEPLKSAQTAAPPRGHMQEPGCVATVRVHGKLTFSSSAIRAFRHNKLCAYLRI